VFSSTVNMVLIMPHGRINWRVYISAWMIFKLMWCVQGTSVCSGYEM